MFTNTVNQSRLLGRGTHETEPASKIALYRFGLPNRHAVGSHKNRSSIQIKFQITSFLCFIKGWRFHLARSNIETNVVIGLLA